MPTIKQRLARGELIGLKLRVAGSENSSLAGTEGEIIDETKNMLAVRSSKGIKWLIKSQCTFEIEKNKEKIKISGKLLAKRPEDRIKRKVKIHEE